MLNKSRIQPVAFFSGALYARKTCYVYLPESYEQTDREYPVIYLLHGRSGVESDWTIRGNIESTLSRLMSEGELSESIVVMPNDGGYGHGTFYLDWYDGTGRFEQYIIEDLIPFIDTQFRTISERESRAIAGLSMGGYGSVYLALKHPDLFGAAASLSGVLDSVQTMEIEHFNRLDLSRIIGPQFGEYAKQHDLYRLTRKNAEEDKAGKIQKPALFVNCGDEDAFIEMNERYHQLLNDLQYAHHFEIHEGAHNWDYWAREVEGALLFIERSLLR